MRTFFLKIFFSLGLVLVCQMSFSQNLTIGQLLELNKKNLGEVEEFLSNKNWEFDNGSEPNSAQLGLAKFSFDRDHYNKALVESNLNYYYSADFEVKRISITIGNKEKYTEYLNGIKSYGCKLIESKIKDGDIIKIYEGATTIFQITITKLFDEDNQERTVWRLMIVKKNDYFENVYWNQ